MNKRILPAALALAVLLAGCGERRPQEAPPAASPLPPETETIRVGTLRLELPRGVDTKAARAVFQALPEKMAPLGVEIETVELTFGASSSATVQALADGGVDLAFLPAADFVRLDREAAPAAGGTAAEPGDGQYNTVRAVPILGGGETRAVVCAGPSEYGTALAGLSARRAPAWEELAHARWGVLGRDSLAGYRCLELWIEDGYEGSGIADLPDVSAYDGWVELLGAAAAGEIDCFPLPEGWETDYGELWTTAADRFDSGGRRGLGRDADIGDEVRAIALTEPLFAGVAAVSPQSQAFAGETFRAALAAALADSFDGPAEEQAVLGADRFAAIAEGALDPLRRLEFQPLEG